MDSIRHTVPIPDFYRLAIIGVREVTPQSLKDLLKVDCYESLAVLLLQMQGLPRNKFVQILRSALAGVSLRRISQASDVPLELLEECIPALADDPTRLESDRLKVLCEQHSGLLSSEPRLQVTIETSLGTYFGEVEDDLPHGEGVLASRHKGVTYCGSWVKGKQHGYGIKALIWDEAVYGQDYQGNWVYEGDWVDGVFNGQGTLYSGERDWYQGSWRAGLRSGYGVFTQRGYSSEGIYESDVFLLGTHRNSSRTLTGQFKYGNRLDGFGILDERDELLYVGEWLKGRHHGQGRLTAQNTGSRWAYALTNGEVFEGQWSHNHVQGQGVLTFTNGTVFKGEFTSTKCGSGVAEFHNGAVYEGAWKGGKFNGQGKLTMKDGLICEAVFLKGKLKGAAKLIWPNGDFVNCNFTRDVLFGNFTLNTVNGLAIKAPLKGKYRHKTLSLEFQCALPPEFGKQATQILQERACLPLDDSESLNEEDCSALWRL
jgi:hypothetical protein